jgi:hypothetical protein
MNRAIRQWALVVTAAMSMLGAAGCDGDTPPQTVDTKAGNESVGTIGLDLALASGAVINTVSYTITGPGGYTKTGSLDVRNSSAIQGLIGGIPSGAGYSITLSATSVDGGTSCLGSASFKVVAHSTTSVMIQVRCHETPRAGSVLINGTLNICPLIDGISINPSQVFVGAPVSLEALAHDSDAAPAALSYSWTASTGSLSDPKSQNPTFACSAAGAATVKLTVSDGDCTDTASVKVECILPDDCSAFDSVMSALGEFTADCRGTIDPREFSIDAAGRMVANFDSCLDKTPPTRIRQLLSLQNKLQLFPNAKACIGGRFAAALDAFKNRGVQTCPTWKLDHDVNPLTDDLVDNFIVPQLPQPDKNGQVVNRVPDAVMAALKFNHAYTVSFNVNPPGQQCEGATNCAEACAEAFPSFVIGPIPGAVDLIETDATSWLDTTLYPTFGGDRYLRNPAFYHPMALAAGGAGVNFGAYNRYWSCSPTTDPANCLHGRAEPCSYNSGGSTFVVPMQATCDDFGILDSCSSYCGAPLTGVLAPPLDKNGFPILPSP